jgi:asparagine synthase (glutamine-hydrolysing)
VDQTVLATDGCSGATGAHEIHLNALARALAPVRLTGNFGSEVLRSMSTFKPLGLASDLLHGEFVQRVKALGSGAAAANEHPVTFAAFREIPWRLFGTLAAGKSQVTFRTPYLDNDLVGLAFRAPAQSRRTPQSALRLIAKADERLARIPTDRGVIGNDRGLAHAARRVWAEVTFKLDYLHKEGLPDSLAILEAPLDGLAKIGVLGLHKYLPYRRWFRHEVATYIRDVLSDPRTERLPFFNRTFLPLAVRQHVEGRSNLVAELNAVLTLEAVDRMLIRASADAPAQSGVLEIAAS